MLNSLNIDSSQVLRVQRQLCSETGPHHNMTVCHLVTNRNSLPARVEKRSVFCWVSCAAVLKVKILKGAMCRIVSCKVSLSGCQPVGVGGMNISLKKSFRVSLSTPTYHSAKALPQNDVRYMPLPAGG